MKQAGTPFHRTRAVLEQEFRTSSPSLHFSSILPGNAETVLAKVAEFEFARAIAKRSDSIYEPVEEAGTWLKQRRSARTILRERLHPWPQFPRRACCR